VYVFYIGVKVFTHKIWNQDIT